MPASLRKAAVVLYLFSVEHPQATTARHAASCGGGSQGGVIVLLLIVAVWDMTTKPGL